MKNRNDKIRLITFGGILTALVILLQYFSNYIYFGPFSITLALIPIIIGAILFGPFMGAWLGFVFGLVVLLSGQAAPFMLISAFGTILTVLLKGMGAGFVAGLLYKVISKKKASVGTIAASVSCPLINTGIFILGCLAFFLSGLKEWAGSENVIKYIFTGLVGTNFIVEFLVVVILCPTIVKILKLTKLYK